MQLRSVNVASTRTAARRAAAAPRAPLVLRRSLAAAPPRAATGSDAAASSDPPARQAIAGFVRGIYKAAAQLQPADPTLSPLWAAVKRLDAGGAAAAIRAGADVNERLGGGDTPLLFIAREGHYKYPPAEIPLALVQAGADLEAKDAKGRTALEVALLSGWQNIAGARGQLLLIRGGGAGAGRVGMLCVEL